MSQLDVFKGGTKMTPEDKKFEHEYKMAQKYAREGIRTLTETYLKMMDPERRATVEKKVRKLLVKHEVRVETEWLVTLKLAATEEWPAVSAVFSIRAPDASQAVQRVALRIPGAVYAASKAKSGE